MKVREATVAKREAELSRQEAATLSGSADAMKREAELAAREQALSGQMAELKAAEAQLQEKKFEAKELQVGKLLSCYAAAALPACCTCCAFVPAIVQGNHHS